MSQSFPSLADIRAAHERIQPFVHRTPILSSTAINEIAGCEIFFKCENFQKVGAFKARGAANAVMKMTDEQKSKGVATHSSGNHAAALARAAKVAGIPAYIVMPSNAPEIKKKAVKGYGGEIIECEPNLKARETTLEEVVKKTGATFIPPYDYMDVIEGQATCALELIEEQADLDVILAPVGGGGLLGGTALAAHYLNPNIEVIGCEPKGADDAFQSFYAGKLIPQSGPNTIADGLLTSLGFLNFELIKTHVSAIHLATDPQIIEAMRLIYERMKIVIEPSCAVPLAALLADQDSFSGKKVGIILSGGNVDLGKLPF
ncbi:pyridoxal-phosphate dependent enzyme [Algoriphagus halophytocola]|uniref:Pyridoxal-phosphate dependent enzyme n=1 Tax=Algoriphagus halophytocola TaxID=2991499 RepID=A0ABY6MC87_9BACT|nr:MULTISPECIES: pyridoxal-phosphate dependent enzyme [unclassified Algoriphagus]UZD21293.1 pyridoxal-phosphate dependent enzyme [Algoriphagus sp. TR-M5]WBL42504.1 pyridoxal-phosphate dependent enzyme [Algoriphagus sp. TR-M9]